MNWITALGLVCLLVSISILARVVPNPWSKDIENDALSGELPDLKTMVRAERHSRRLRTRQRAFGVGAMLLLVAALLFLLAPAMVSTVVTKDGGSSESRPLTGGDGTLSPAGGIVSPGTVLTGPVVLPPPPPASGRFWHEPVFLFPAVLILLLFIAGFVLIARRSTWAGSASLIAAATLSAQLHLIRELKFEVAPHFHYNSKSTPDTSQSLTNDQIKKIVDDRIDKLKNDLTALIDSRIKAININDILSRIAEINIDIKGLKADIEAIINGRININIDKVTLEAKIDAYLRQFGALGPQRLEEFTGFEQGSPDLKEDMKESITKVCNQWGEHAANHEGLLIVVGSTDRVPLGRAARLRYESNVGLARARAEQVKSRIATECRIAPKQILAIVSGPRTTPEQRTELFPDPGYPEDRMVDVWAVWSWRDRR